MRNLKHPTYLFFLMVLFQNCNTLYNSKTINIEVLVPGKAKINDNYRNLALVYNNWNVSFNPVFCKFFEDSTILIDNTNIDSTASKIYFDVFKWKLKDTKYFDTITELPAVDYSNITINDSLVSESYNDFDSLSNNSNPEVNKLVRQINRFGFKKTSKGDVIQIDPKFGLFTRYDLENIRHETGAEILMSLDFFAAIDGINSQKYRGILSESQTNITTYLQSYSSREMVMVLTGWSIYDLNEMALKNYYQHIDTIEWHQKAFSLREAKKVLPPRRDAVLNAADLAAGEFGEFLAPHWVNVDRMYYQSGQTELKQTDKLITKNQWLDAAEIWKRNVYNKNKKIAAKSMFNLGLACEMNGNIDAAIDWVTKSYLVLGNRYEIHAYNCNSYIRILAQRKLDIKKIEN